MPDLSLLLSLVTGGTEPAETGFMREIIDLLKTGGPYTITAAAVYWGYRKDKDHNDASKEHNEQMQAMFNQVVNLTNTQTAAVSKMEGMIGALREAVNALDRHLTK